MTLKKQKLILFILSGLYFGFFIYLSVLVNWDIFRELDYSSMVTLQSLIPRPFDYYLSLLTLLGSSEITITIVLMIFIWMLFKKKQVFLGVFLFFLIYCVELIGKLIIYHPKPPVVFNRYAIEFHFPSAFIVQTNYSYPSGHMARISFVATLLLFMVIISKTSKLNKFIKAIPIMVLTILMFISRIYLGDHWLTDVFGGLILGQMVSFITLIFL